MKMAYNKLQNPLFLLSLILLLLNDFYLKATFGNVVTGKLSDFSGLFAFPFFFSCLFPHLKKTIHLITVLIFIWWKSILSQPFIDFVNVYGIPVNRVIDMTDNIALISVLLSYHFVSKAFEYQKVKPVLSIGIAFVALFAFTATSLPPRTAVEYTSVDKVYSFDIPVEELISRFNILQKKEIEKMTCKDCNWGYFDEEKGVFFSNQGDTITYIIGTDRHKNNDTIHIRNYYADLQLYSIDDNSSGLKLINIAAFIRSDKIKDIESTSTSKYPYPVWFFLSVKSQDSSSVKPFEKKAIKAFEKRVIKKLK